MMNTNQLNTDLGNDNKVEMNVGLNVIKEDEKWNLEVLVKNNLTNNY